MRRRRTKQWRKLKTGSKLPVSQNPVGSLSAPRSLTVPSGPEAAQFFINLQNRVRCKRPVLFLDLSRVRDVTLEALAYLLSIVLDRTGSDCKVSGNLPKDPAARELFRRSGFLDFMLTRDGLPPHDERLFSIHRGHNVDTQSADALITFVMRAFSLTNNTPLTRSLYRTLVECMANTNNHAYASLTIRRRRKFWYVAASVNMVKNTVDFVFLDSGDGIPATIRTHWAEWFKSLVVEPDDAKLLRSAVQGEFRTRTKQHKRGKGLPSIHSQVKQGQLENLAIRSLKGRVSASGEELEATPMSWRFQGTLLSWSVRKL